MLPSNLTVLDLSHNLLTGTLPNSLPANLSALNISSNHLVGTLPNTWHVPIATLRLDNNSFVGHMPPSWSLWGKNSGNSLQLSITDAGIGGKMPQQWVQQFCLSATNNSSRFLLFDPLEEIITVFTDSKSHFRSAFIVTYGDRIAITAEHASINVTLNGKLYAFDYNSPDSMCGIPHAIRNAALLWGIFTALLLCLIISLRVYLKRSGALTSAGAFTVLRVVRSFTEQKHVQRYKPMVAKCVFFFSDILWYIYSQVTDAITIHQVFSSKQPHYGFLLLALLLLPFLVMFLIVAWAYTKQRLSKVYVGIERHRFKSALWQAFAVLAGVAICPVLFLALEANMMLEGMGFHQFSKFVPLEDASMSTLYRTQSFAESFMSAFPQALLQTKLYTMGNDPKGVHVYISTTLFLYSVVASLASILKTVGLMMIEVNQCSCNLFVYLKKLIDLKPFEEAQTERVQASGPMGRAQSTQSDTGLLPHTRSAELKAFECEVKV